MHRCATRGISYLTRMALVRDTHTHFWQVHIGKCQINCDFNNQDLLKSPVRFAVLYHTKKFSFFMSNKDIKVPLNSKSNVVYQITCIGCNKSYIRETFRCLDDWTCPIPSNLYHNNCIKNN